MKIFKILLISGMFVFALGCKGHKKGKTTAAPVAKKADKSAEKPKAEKLSTAKAPAAKPTEAKEAVKKAEAKTPTPPADITDKANLEKCYLELYCAQKNGNMAGLLKIYKKYGFDTPKKWTKAYIEAAKDTDWVSELARKASKACKKKK